MENSNFPYHVIDYTTCWAEWIAYCEICHQLGIKDQPSVQRFMRYNAYLKEIGVK